MHTNSASHLLDDRTDRWLYARRSFTRDLLPARNTVANEPTYLECGLHKRGDASRGEKGDNRRRGVGLEDTLVRRGGIISRPGTRYHPYLLDSLFEIYTRFVTSTRLEDHEYHNEAISEH